MSDKFVIMFVCTGNTCRSPMAEVALRMLLEKERSGMADVISSGTAGAIGFPATMYAAEAAKIWDCDLSEHESQPLTEELIDRSDLILAMAPSHHAAVTQVKPEAKSRTYLFKNFPDRRSEGEAVDDPIGQPLDMYNRTFLEIGEYLGKFLPEIVKRIDEKTNAG